MGDFCLIGGVIKILELPTQTIFENNQVQTEFICQFPQMRSNLLVSVICWGNLGYDIVYYFGTSDYILIEGYFSSQVFDEIDSGLKTFTITLSKAYSFSFV